MASSSEHHIIHLILGKPAHGESFTAEHYARAARLWREWRDSGVLRRDDAPAYYMYDCLFDDLVTGLPMCRHGVIGALKLSPFDAGDVLPHEEVFPGPLSDRERLLAATDAVFSLVFTLYDPPDTMVFDALHSVESEVVADYTDAQGTVHRVRRVSDPEALARTSEAFARQPLIIADGHHRYTAALGHAERTGRLGTNLPGARTIACAVNARCPGVRAYGTHRLFACGGKAPDLEALKPYASVTCIDASPGRQAVERLERTSTDKPTFVFATRDGLALVVIEEPAKLGELLPSLHPISRKQPLTLLHRVLIEKALGLTADHIDAAGGVSHSRDADEALGLVASGRFDLAILVRSPTVDEMVEVCAAGQRMPHKSTYFYPKLASGVTLYDLAEG